MKTSNPIKLISLIIAGALLGSCKMNNLSLTVHEPAPVSIPGAIKKVGIINRSAPAEDTKENKVIEKVDQIMNAKSPELDKEGSLEAIRGVKDALMQNNRFSDVVRLDNVDLRTTAMSGFPSPISWEQVEKICKDNNVDALFALEEFNTEAKITYSTSSTTMQTPLGNVPGVMTHAHMANLVKTGWRIYDPQKRLILDEFPISRTLNFNASGANPVAAAAALLERKEAVKQTGYSAGQIYAQRILPYSIRVERDYYVKGNVNFRIAMRKARTGNWDGAADLWLKETTNTKRKIRGRACYNMAIICEINGQLTDAINWASKAYEEDGNRHALYYLNILKWRKSENDRLNRQLDESH